MHHKYNCSSCNYKSNFKNDITKHITRIKNNKCNDAYIIENDIKCICNNCNKEYKLKNSLIKHEKLCNDKQIKIKIKTENIENNIKINELKLKIKFYQNELKNLKNNINNNNSNNSIILSPFNSPIISDEHKLCINNDIIDIINENYSLKLDITSGKTNIEDHLNYIYISLMQSIYFHCDYINTNMSIKLIDNDIYCFNGKKWTKKNINNVIKITRNICIDFIKNFLNNNNHNLPNTHINYMNNILNNLNNNIINNSIKDEFIKQLTYI